MNKVTDLDEVMERVHDGATIMFASKMCNLIKFMVYNIDTIRVTPRGLCEALAELATV